MNILEDAINQQAALDLYNLELRLMEAHANWQEKILELQTETIVEQQVALSSSY